jgi:hypothetical protein
MGTSSPYSPPSNGDWSQLKGDLTSLTKDPSNSGLQTKVLGEFVDAIGGAVGFSSSNKMGNKGGAFSSASGRKVAQSVGNFLSSIQNKGLEKTLEERNLEYLSHKSIDEIRDELVDHFADPSNDGDSIAARKAIDKILDDILKHIDNFEDLEKALGSVELEYFLCDFFANYISELFYRTFDEEYQNKNNVNSRDAARVLKQIEKDIKERVKSCQIDKPLSKLDWQSQEAQNMVQNILKESLELLQD